MPKLGKWLIPALAIGALVALWLLAPSAPDSRGVPIAYSQFKSLVQKRAVESVRLRGQTATGTFVRPQPVGPNNAEAKRFRTTVPSTGDPALLPALETAGVRVEVSASEEGGVVWRLIVGLLPWILIIGVYIWLWKGMFRNVAGGGLGGNGVTKFLEGQATKVQKTKETITFDDVAGQDNAKRDVAELVDYLSDPDKYRALGAEIPHGVLLVGPPGTGKTLLARALAGESGVPFFSISASEFIEVFVGVGHSHSHNASCPPCVVHDFLNGRRRHALDGGEEHPLIVIRGQHIINKHAVARRTRSLL